MRLLVLADPQEVALAAARRIAAALRNDPELTLALPTGRTPLHIYAELIRRHREEGLSFREASVFDLDEYVGLPADHPLSCAAFLRAQLFERIDLERIDLLDGNAADPAAECERYERAIARAGGLGLALLGLGRNGHLAMNEPGTPFDSRTSPRTLTATTLADNARLYPAGTQLPTEGLSMGLRTICDAREVLLVAFGEHKRSALAAALEGPVGTACPASALQTHPGLTVIADHAAAAGLSS